VDCRPVLLLIHAGDVVLSRNSHRETRNGEGMLGRATAGEGGVRIFGVRDGGEGRGGCVVPLPDGIGLVPTASPVVGGARRDTARNGPA